MKRVRLAVLLGIMCLGVSACSAEDIQRAAGAIPETAGASGAESSAADTEGESSEASAEAESGAEKEDEKAAGVQEIYADMDGIVFGFYSGVGAWETMLEVAPDGSFKGQFYDSHGYNLYGFAPEIAVTSDNLVFISMIAWEGPGGKGNNNGPIIMKNVSGNWTINTKP